VASVDRDTLYDAYVTRGLTVRAVAKECGISPQRVSQLLWKYHIPARPRGTANALAAKQRAATVLTRQLLFELYWVQELSLQELAKQTGFSLGTIRSRMAEERVPLRIGGGTPPPGRKGYDIRPNQIAELRGQGLTQAEIAARIGCSTLR
jgi:transcriptional regulator with XRE-family HTH domain